MSCATDIDMNTRQLASLWYGSLLAICAILYVTYRVGVGFRTALLAEANCIVAIAILTSLSIYTFGNRHKADQKTVLLSVSVPLLAILIVGGALLVRSFALSRGTGTLTAIKPLHGDSPCPQPGGSQSGVGPMELSPDEVEVQDVNETTHPPGERGKEEPTRRQR